MFESCIVLLSSTLDKLHQQLDHQYDPIQYDEYTGKPIPREPIIELNLGGWGGDVFWG